MCSSASLFEITMRDSGLGVFPIKPARRAAVTTRVAAFVS
jgi:hypothetical protein